MNLQSNYFLNIDFKPIFGDYLKNDFVQFFFKDSSQNNPLLTESLKSGLKYHKIYQKPPKPSFYYLIKGLFTEYGYQNTPGDVKKATEIYQKGYLGQSDNLCALKLAQIYYNLDKNNNSKIMFYNDLFQILLNIQYKGFCNQKTEQNTTKLSKKEFLQYLGDSKQIYGLLHDIYCEQNKEISLDQVIKHCIHQINVYEDQFALIFLLRLNLSGKIVKIGEEKIKQLILIVQNTSVNCLKALFDIFFEEIKVIKCTQNDSLLFANFRELFFSVCLLYLHQNQEIFISVRNIIWEIVQLIYSVKNIFINQHEDYILLIQIRTKLQRKGYEDADQIENIYESNENIQQIQPILDYFKLKQKLKLKDTNEKIQEKLIQQHEQNLQNCQKSEQTSKYLLGNLLLKYKKDNIQALAQYQKGSNSKPHSNLIITEFLSFKLTKKIQQINQQLTQQKSDQNILLIINKDEIIASELHADEAISSKSQQSFEKSSRTLNTYNQLPIPSQKSKDQFEKSTYSSNNSQSKYSEVLVQDNLNTVCLLDYIQIDKSEDRMGQILKDVQLFDYGVLNGVVKMKNNNLFAKIDEETNVIIYQILVSDVDLFENTIKIITNLKHENLLQIKAFNYEKQPFNGCQKLYFMQSFIQINLHELIKKKLVSKIEEKIQISIKICKAIQYLHQNQIFNCNIKPENILFQQTSQPLISGWQLYQLSKIKIYYGYTAPEIVNFQRHNNGSQDIVYDEKSDIWSIGMVVYYIFFEVDNTNYKLCKEKKIYEGFNVIIPECKQKRNIYLERIGEIVESACKFEKKERISIEKVIEKLEKVIVSNKEFVD